MAQDESAANEAKSANSGKLTLEYENGLPVVRVAGGARLPDQIAIVGPDGEALGTYTTAAAAQMARPLTLRPEPSSAPDVLTLAEENGLVPSFTPTEGPCGVPAS
jgi:hypothetical protein